MSTRTWSNVLERVVLSPKPVAVSFNLMYVWELLTPQINPKTFSRAYIPKVYVYMCMNPKVQPQCLVYSFQSHMCSHQPLVVLTGNIVRLKTKGHAHSQPNAKRSFTVFIRIDLKVCYSLTHFVQPHSCEASSLHIPIQLSSFIVQFNVQSQ